MEIRDSTQTAKFKLYRLVFETPLACQTRPAHRVEDLEMERPPVCDRTSCTLISLYCCDGLCKIRSTLQVLGGSECDQRREHTHRNMSGKLKPASWKAEVSGQRSA